MPDSPARHDSGGSTSAEDAGRGLARFVLEDFVVTSLLRLGKSLSSNDLTAAAEGFQLSRAVIKEGLAQSQRVVHSGRGWDLAIRVKRQSVSREERERQPLQGAIEELLHFVGKPLPLPVITREITLLRGSSSNTTRDAVANILRNSRSVVEGAADTWIHESFILEPGAREESLVLRENRLEDDADLQRLKNLDLAGQSTALFERAVAILRAADHPIPCKLLGFLLWRQDPAGFATRAVIQALGDREVFYWMVGGVITLRAQLPQWRGELQRWAQSLSESNASSIDVAALLRQRMAANEIIAPRAEDVEELKAYARGSDGLPFSLGAVMVDRLEIEPDNPHFVPALQGLNDALRRHPDFLPVGIGRFLLREAVPEHIGQVPDSLRPVHLSVRDPETDEPMDFEMSDDGLEGDAAAFIHAPQWEDINEEVEVKLARRPGTEAPDATRYVVLSHHHSAGTIKLRRMDEDFFALEGGLSRITVQADDGQSTTELGAWASRESGLIYGLGEWFAPRTPHSGGVLIFCRDTTPGRTGQLRLTLGEPDKPTSIDANRAEELESLRAAATYMSLFELLQTIMGEHQQGVELPRLWAEVNVVRRTTKRLICSILSGYHCYYFKQRGPTQILWRFDAGKLDQGVKRNKRKYVRR
ncbi:MAG TPA: hypothetical protein VNA16_03475 [Abditibacteriaceae bacterium]|nr:hypothetical protein [Abditibacteriaceae bacterium]